MKPISIAILWHQHQPYYKKESEFILPWVRLHGVKDYADLVMIVKEFPSIKQTFNLVPSLMMQIQEYIHQTTTDKIERLTLIEAQNLTKVDKQELLRLFFLCNYTTMIAPYPRYRQLFELSQDSSFNALESFSQQDWLDLQCWYNLTWIGQISRQDSSISSLFRAGGTFSEKDKSTILTKHRQILDSILPLLKQVQLSNQCEISVTPMYHPILPLVIDTNSHREASPKSSLPKKRFSFPEDADWHLAEAHSFYTSLFGKAPSGCWPSEGSVSSTAVQRIKNNGFQWTATDEQVLYNSLQDSSPLQHCFPHSFSTADGNISLFFRDHTLSDTIGFLYSTWNAHDAANDFVQRILQKREEIIRHYGEDALDEAVLSIILDGENCWEYYPNNGIDFLRALFTALSHPLIQTRTFQEVAKPNQRFHLDSIVAGSWINGTFSIWIGNQDENTAWSVLADARNAIEKSTAHPEKIREAKKYAYIAEGSDTFWWYGNDHQAENRNDFDDLFRYYIRKCYTSLELSVPAILQSSLRNDHSFQREQPQRGSVDVLISFTTPNEANWENAGYILPSLSSGAIHSTIEILECIRYAYDVKNGFVGLKIETKRTLSEDESILLEFTDSTQVSILVSRKSVQVFQKNGERSLEKVFAKLYPSIEVGIGETVFENFLDNSMKTVLVVTVSTKEATIRYPQQGTYSLQFVL